jgi:CBS domain-containing protein
MTTVRDVMKGKPSEIWSVGPRDTVFYALTIMAEREIGAVIVMDGNSNPVGIFSERDYARKVILRGKVSKETAVEEIMTPVSEMYGVRPESTLDEAMLLISGQKVRHLPVFNGNNVIGLISIGDVLKFIIADKDIQIEHLSSYIAGRYV